MANTDGADAERTKAQPTRPAAPKSQRDRSRPALPSWAKSVLLMLGAFGVVGVLFWMISARAPANPVGAPPADAITNTIGMKLKLIPAGMFKMGSPDSDKEAAPDEKPQHDVEITRPFYMGVYPVTAGQFAAFVKDADYKTAAEQAGDKETWRTPNFSSTYDQTADDPVVEVTWNDAIAFCAWLSKKEGKTYELPTEAQWEYACRAGTTTIYSFGDDSKLLDAYAWYGDNSGGHTHPVGGKKPNAWGLFDMQGNVWQWCSDYYDPKYYINGCKEDPKNLTKSDARVVRGGAWHNNPVYCRAAYRNRDSGGYRDNDYGLRVCFRPD